MRTKALLCAAAVAAGAVSAMAQTSNVYSLNVVGYVNVTVPTGYSLIANPLDAGNNTVSNLFNASNPLGAVVYYWSGTAFVADTLDLFGQGWLGTPGPALNLPPGTGFFINNNTGSPFTNTFVGTVLQGSLVNTPPSGYSLLASKVPQAGYTADLGLTPGLGDTIYMWSGTAFIAINYDLFGTGWFPATGFTVDNVKGPYVNLSQSFFYNNTAGTATWVRNFTVQ